MLLFWKLKGSDFGVNSMTDEGLITQLRDLSAGPSDYLQEIGNKGADRIEQLLEELSACTGGTGGCGYWREATKKRDEQIENMHLLIDELTKTCETLVSERERLHKALLKERGINYE